MNLEERNKFTKTFFERHCLVVMQTKGKEYSRSEEDANSNFKRVGAAIELDPIKVAYIYMAKHWDGITNYIKTGKIESEGIEGRLGDLINYAIILASLLQEKYNENYSEEKKK